MRLIDADVLLEPIADCEERETCVGCPCRILDCEDFERVLKAAPTVEPTNKVIAEVKVDTDEIMKHVNEEILPLIPKWIPVTERLPEAEEMGDTGVIATVVGEEGNVTYRHGIVPDAWYENGSWHVYGVRLKNARVIAWMPLPEPYKEEQE